MTTPFSRFTRPRPPPDCSHLGTIAIQDSDATECPSCLAEGSAWVHLRMCLQCGEVGCCDNSEKRHARRHNRDTQHPLIRSIEPGERWVWCYPDAGMVSEMPAS